MSQEVDVGLAEPKPQEWLRILLMGPDAFNDFRERFPMWKPLFPRNADLRHAKLARANLRDAYLMGAKLQEADLLEADFQNADLLEAHMEGANLAGANLQGASLWWAHLPGADMSRAQLSNAQLQDADLHGATLVGAELVGADMRSAQLQHANLTDAKLQGASLNFADLQQADLRGAHFDGANIIGADFRGGRVNQDSCILSRRKAGQVCGDNETADTDGLMQWSQLYKTHGEFELASHCYYRARQHYRRQRLAGLTAMSPSWTWAKIVNVLETVFLDWSCAYGEKPGRTLFTGLSIIVLSAFIYVWNASYFIDGNDVAMPGSLVKALYLSTLIFTTLGLDYRPQTGQYPADGWWLPLYVGAEAICGALMMSLFLITFARRMTRD